jgi:hypothetical protein
MGPPQHASAQTSAIAAFGCHRHKTEAVYERYAIVAESDLRDASAKLTAALGSTPESAPLSDHSGDNSVTARRASRLSG